MVLTAAGPHPGVVRKSDQVYPESPNRGCIIMSETIVAARILMEVRS